MGATQVLAPVFVQVALTFVLFLWMGRLRYADIRSGEVRPADVVLGQPNWSTKTTQLMNAFRNQFELPVLFYLVSVLALFTARAGMTLVALAWVFVVSRILHALIHVTTNNLRRRGILYAVGGFVLIAMWVDYFLELYFGSTATLPPLDMDALDLPQTVQ
jgi:hypothetical protein